VLLVLFFTLAGSLTMLRSQRRLRYPLTWLRLTRWAISLSFTLLPLLAVSSLPRHHPSDLHDPPFLSQWLRGYDGRTGTVPMWDR
jgi:hypothetical protein